MPNLTCIRTAQFLLLVLLQGQFLCAADTASQRDVTFIAHYDKSSQKYVIQFPETYNVKKSYDVLIALHGHGSDRWQFMKGDFPEAQATRAVANKFNMILIAPDYRAKTSWMGPAAEADLVQIIAEVKQQHPIKRIFLCGASMGGASTLTFAAMHPQLLAGAASMNGTANHLEYKNFQSAIQKSFGGTKSEIPQEYKKRSAEYWPEKLTMPIALAVGGQDKSVPPDSVLRLAQILKNLKRPMLLIHREQGGHSTTFQDATTILEYIINKADKK